MRQPGRHYVKAPSTASGPLARYKGKVRSIQPYGAVKIMPGKDGLLHISE
jgi:polyribonucleotide nucleotidyltransferase